jgi:FtsP/CotA-like multicopper oxidase with cupredoxin domain
MKLAPNRRAFLTGVAAVALPLPARAEDSGARVIEARSGKAQLLPPPAPMTDILGFDGVSPGPLIRHKQGETLLARLVNKTEKPLSLHWQGLRGENAMDGVVPLTQAPVAPGSSFDYRRPLTDPGLFCYRPSVFPQTGELMGRGLKGLLVVDETNRLESDVDLVVALDDWRLDAKGAVEGKFDDAGEAKAGGRLGNLLTVNGARAPASYEHPPLTRVRLRLANLANARIMALSFEGATPYTIAIDSQPCDAFVPVRKTIPVAPGARFELMFDLPAEQDAKMRVILRGADGQDRDLLVFAAKGEARKARPPIRSLPQNPALPPAIDLSQSKKVDIVVAQNGAGWTLNGAASKAYAGEPLFRVKRGAAVTLGFDNRTAVPLVMHVHGHCVRLLHDLDDGWEPYWRNAVVVPPTKTKHVAFLADSPGKWALHDDILEHEAAGVATWFEVG